MDAHQYIEQRLDDQIAWYDRKSQRNQQAYRYLKIFELAAASAIPLLTGLIKPDTPWHIVVGILGALIAVCSGVAGMFKFHELWIEYRAVTEALRHQKFLFLTRARPYHESNAFPVLVETVEGILAKENASWRSFNPPKREEEQTATASDGSSVAAVGA
jgi:Protein of unknown function (DUF4231)